jgi:hypothetical protein
VRVVLVGRGALRLQIVLWVVPDMQTCRFRSDGVQLELVLRMIVWNNGLGRKGTY